MCVTRGISIYRNSALSLGEVGTDEPLRSREGTGFELGRQTCLGQANYMVDPKVIAHRAGSRVG